MSFTFICPAHLQTPQCVDVYKTLKTDLAANRPDVSISADVVECNKPANRMTSSCEFTSSPMLCRDSATSGNSDCMNLSGVLPKL